MRPTTSLHPACTILSPGFGFWERVKGYFRFLSKHVARVTVTVPPDTVLRLDHGHCPLNESSVQKYMTTRSNNEAAARAITIYNNQEENIYSLCPRDGYCRGVMGHMTTQSTVGRWTGALLKRQVRYTR